VRLEERGLSLADQNIGVVSEFLAMLHQALCCLPHGLRSESHLGGQRRAAGEVAADVLDKVFTTPRTHDRATVERIGGEFRLGPKPGPT
jgi:hypothetical protein